MNLFLFSQTPAHTGPAVLTAPVLARMTTPPDTARTILINQTWTQLVNAGLAAKLDLLYLTAAHDAQAATLNWAQAQYDLVPVNSPTFTTDRGVAGNGTSSYYETGFNGSNTNPARQYQRDAACQLVYVNTSVISTSQIDFGQGRSWVCCGYSTTAFRYSPNASGSFSATAAGNNGVGMYGWLKDSITTASYVRNTSVTAAAISTTNTFNVNWLLAAAMGNGSVPGNYSTRRISFAACGAYLAPPEYLTLHAIIMDYLNAVGAA